MKGVDIDPSRFFEFTLQKVVLSNLGNVLLYEQFNSHSWFWDQLGFYLQIGNYFPVRLNYDKSNGNIDYEIVEKRIPEPVDMDTEGNIMYQTGVINRIMFGGFNRYFRNTLSTLSPNVKNFIIYFYNDDITYECSQIRTKGFENYTDSLEKKIKEFETGSVQDQGNVLKSEKSQNVNMFYETLKTEKESNACYKILGGNLEEKLKETSYLNLSEKKKRSLIPAFYLSLISRKVQIIYEPEEKKEKKKLDSGEEKRKVKLNGKFVVADPYVTGAINSDEAPDFPDPKTLFKAKPTNYLPLPLNGLSCSSINPYFKVDSETLRSAAIRKFQAKEKDTDFFFLYARQKNHDPDNRILFYLYTNAENKSGEYWVYNKSQIFKLKIDLEKEIELLGEFAGSKLHTYTGYFTKEELAQTGLYWLVFESDKFKPSFDCFPGSAFNELNVKTDFLIYSSIQKEINVVILENFEYELMNTKKKFMIYVFPWILLFIILAVLAGGAVFYLVYMKKDVSKKEEISPKEIEEKQENQVVDEKVKENSG